MARDALDRLVEDVHALPVVADAEQPAFAPRGADRRVPPPARRHAVPAHELRIRVRELLAELARRIDASYPQTLAQAHGAWDQIDALKLIDKAVTDEVRALERAARLFQADDEPELRALGTEAQLTLEAALGLVSLVERRLATIVRLRLRATHPSRSDENSREERAVPGGQAAAPASGVSAEGGRQASLRPEGGELRRSSEEGPPVDDFSAALLPEGRPFLDLGAALHETARRWT